MKIDPTRRVPTYTKLKDERNSLSSDAETPDITDITGEYHWAPARSIEDADLLQNNSETPRLKNHAVLCILSTKDCLQTGLVNFVRTLRTTHFNRQELVPIVIVGDREYLREEWDAIQYFPEVYLIRGSPLNSYNMRHANLGECKMCAILSVLPNLAENRICWDKDALLCTLSIKNMNFDYNYEPYTEKTLYKSTLYKNTLPGHRCFPTLTVFDSCNLSCCRVLVRDDKTSGKNILARKSSSADLRHHALRRSNSESIEEDDLDTPFFLTKAYACGRVYTLEMLDALVSAAYFNCHTMRVVQALLTGNSSTEVDIAAMEELSMMPRTNLDPKPGNRCRIAQLSFKNEPLKQFTSEGKSYGTIFLWLLKNHGIMCLGIYRLLHPLKSEARASKRYVITNPPSEFMCMETDEVFILKPYGSKRYPVGSREDGNANTLLDECSTNESMPNGLADESDRPTVISFTF